MPGAKAPTTATATPSLLMGWDELVEYQRRLAGSSSTGSGNASAPCLRKLRLLPNARQNYLLAKDRVIVRIPLRLRKAVGEVMEGRESWPLFLHGGIGSGKTSAALCMADHVDGAIYQRFDELAIRLVEAGKGLLVYPLSGNRVFPQNLWAEIEAAPLTVLDEVGFREKASDWQYDVLMTYLQRREGKPFVIVGNCDMGGVIESFDYRVASRLARATAVHCDWDDMRPGTGEAR